MSKIRRKIGVHRAYAALQVRNKVAKLEEEKQGIERKMQDRLDQEEQNSRAAQEAADQRVANLEEQLRQSTSSSASKPPAGSQPPAMAAPGRMSDCGQQGLAEYQKAIRAAGGKLHCLLMERKYLLEAQPICISPLSN